MKFLKGLIVLIAQAAVTLGVFYLLTQTIWLSNNWIYTVAGWVIMPVLGLYSAYYARKFGLFHYLAWIAPPICVFAAHYLVTFYTPDAAGPTLLTALFSITGAAAAEVRRVNRAG